MALLCAGTALAMTGCYERVTRVEGAGNTRNVDVYEANYDDSRVPIVTDLEDAIFGKRVESKFTE